MFAIAMDKRSTQIKTKAKIKPLLKLKSILRIPCRKSGKRFNNQGAIYIEHAKINGNGLLGEKLIVIPKKIFANHHKIS